MLHEGVAAKRYLVVFLLGDQEAADRLGRYRVSSDAATTGARVVLTVSTESDLEGASAATDFVLEEAPMTYIFDLGCIPEPIQAVSLASLGSSLLHGAALLSVDSIDSLPVTESARACSY